MSGPKTLDELLVVVPGLRKTRSLNAEWLRRLLDRAKGECTWCGQPVPKGRLTWCSEQCITNFRSRCDSGFQRQMVTERDRGVCEACGRDTVATERACERARLDEHGTARISYRQLQVIQERFGWVKQGGWREVDHIIPVVEGGGLLGPDNLRLLCGACHAAATKRLAGRRAKGKR